MKSKVCILSVLLLFVSANAALFADEDAKKELKKMYDYHCKQSSDIRDHVPVLKNLANECTSVMEIGIRSMVSTWGVLQGLSENGASHRRYIGVDLNYPPVETFALALRLAESNDIDFNFLKQNDMEINVQDMKSVDMLFIDSLHTYCHLLYELEKFSPKVNKYISMHDTSEPWGIYDDNTYTGNYSEYPAHYDRIKRGLWMAVEDFLSKHPEWVLLERRFNNHGFTILKRIA